MCLRVGGSIQRAVRIELRACSVRGGGRSQSNVRMTPTSEGSRHKLGRIGFGGRFTLKGGHLLELLLEMPFC
jgi:hypothetical protein